MFFNLLINLSEKNPKIIPPLNKYGNMLTYIGNQLKYIFGLK